MRTTFSAHKSKLLPILIVVALAICAGRAVVLSAHWKLIHDGITMQYIALMMTKGVLPYRDIFDMNFPLTYWIHALGMFLLGKGDIATRSYDLLWCYFAALAIAACLWRENRPVAISAALAFVLLHIGNGYMNQLQRDMYIATFLAGGLYFILRNPKPLIAGILVGAACSVKPVAAFYAAFVFLALGRKGQMLAYVVGCAVVPVVSFAWMTALGIWAPFWQILTEFTLPVFASDAFDDTFDFRIEIPCYALLAIILHIIAFRKELRSQHSMLLVSGIIYGLLHYYLQRKGYDQHLYPFWAMLCISAGTSMARLLREAPVTASCIALAWLAVIAPWKGASGLWHSPGFFSETPLVAASERIEELMKNYYMPEPGSTVQVMEDVFGTSWRIAYKYEWKPGIRFMYPFVIYAGKDKPVMQRYRDEFAREIIRRRPETMLLSNFTWPQYKQLVFNEFERLPGMSFMLSGHYALLLQNGRIKLWERKY